MKITKTIIGVVAGLTLSLSAHAGLYTFAWQFPTGQRTDIVPDSVSGGPPVGTAAFSDTAGSFNTWYAKANSSGLEGLYGTTQTGLWDVQDGGSISIRLNRTGTSWLDYTLVVRQFVDSFDPNHVNGVFTPGLLTFSTPGVQFNPLTDRTIVETAGIGTWVSDTYHWTAVNLNGAAATMTITPTTTGGITHMFVDSLTWSINGDLVAPIPEPIYAQGLAAVALLGISIVSWRRRQAAKA